VLSRQAVAICRAVRYAGLAEAVGGAVDPVVNRAVVAGVSEAVAGAVSRTVNEAVIRATFEVIRRERPLSGPRGKNGNQESR
jgi:hypothetical protein